MKNSHLSKIVGASVLALSLASVPMIQSASAQTNTTTPNRTSVDNRQGSDYAGYDRDFDWGWLGLLGLIGLAGLAGRKSREEPTRYRDPNEVGSSGTRY